jgi:geranylgeranylglycerol-phosphate geranylgeranyltransferase
MIGFSIIVSMIIAGGLNNLRLINIIYSFITGFSLSGAAMTINDYFDRFIDSINEPERPIPSGEVSIRGALILTAILSLMGFVTAYLTCLSCFLLAFLAWFVMMIYAYWGKGTGLLGNLLVSTCVTISFIYGGVIVGEVEAITLFSLMAFLSNMGREVTKGIVDIDGDKVENIRTIAVKRGRGAAADVSSIFYFIAIILSILPYYLDMVSIFYLLFIILTDAIFLHGIYILQRDPSRSNSRKVKNRVLYGMLLALIGFAIGRLF